MKVTTKQLRKIIREQIKKLKEGMSPEEWADAKEAERLANHPEKEKIMKIRQMMDKEKEDAEFDAEQEEWDKGWYGESLKELASELGYLEEEESDDKKSDDEGPDHGKLRTSPSGTKFRVWDKKTDMMGNPRGSTRKDRNAWGFPKKK